MNNQTNVPVGGTNPSPSSPPLGVSKEMQALVEDVIGHAAIEMAGHLGSVIGRNKLQAATPVAAKAALLTAIAALEAENERLSRITITFKSESTPIDPTPDTGDTAALDDLLNELHLESIDRHLGYDNPNYEVTRQKIHAHVAALVQAKREKIAKKIEACCHCLPDYTRRDRIDPSCECHDHADIAREDSNA